VDLTSASFKRLFLEVLCEISGDFLSELRASSFSVSLQINISVLSESKDPYLILLIKSNLF